MGLPLAGIAAKGIFGKLLPTIVGGLSSLFSNAQSRKFSKDTYKTQYDQNLANWHRQNRYNDPAAQMQRLQEAGLNPAMMYGGSGGSASSGQSSSQVKTPDVQTPQFNTIDTTQAIPNIMSIYDIAIKKGQKGLIDQQITNAALKNKGDLIDFNTKRRLVNISADAALTNIDATKQGIAASQENQIFAGRRDIREELNSKAALLNDATKNKLMELEHEIRKDGGNPNDPTWQKRMLMIIDDPKKVAKIVDAIKNYFKRTNKDGKKPIFTQPLFLEILNYFKKN